MENAIFLSKKVAAVFEKITGRKEQLNALADLLKKECGTSVYFCEIIGARWSFVAGDRTLDIPEHRIKLNDFYGIMAGEILCTDSLWQEALEILREKMGE